MASAKAESTPIFISLILFVILSIVLGVTTFIFHKAEEDAITARKQADERRTEAEEETKEVQARIDTMKEIVGAKPDPANPVDEIMENYKEHQNIFGETYDKNEANIPDEKKLEDSNTATYPLMLEYLVDMNKELHDQVAQKNSNIREINAAHDAEKTKLISSQKETQSDLNDLSEKIRLINESFDRDRADFETKYKKATDDLRASQDKIAESQDKSRRKMNKMTEKLNEVDSQLNVTTNQLRNARKIDLEAPDGEVIWVNQVEGTVYIDLGYRDGLRRQTTFSVYDHNVANALTAEPKGTLEIVRVDENMSVAKVTSDQLSGDRLLNPILKGDKVISTVFHRGQPERFAIVGKIDIDGDGNSDLPLLLRLIEQNGGTIDVFMDDLGNIGGEGKITPRTKFLIMGQKPTDKTEEKLLEAYNKVVKAAASNGVRVLPLKDLLDHMGYEGQAKSVGLGKNANPEDFIPTGGG